MPIAPVSLGTRCRPRTKNWFHQGSCDSRPTPLGHCSEERTKHTLSLGDSVPAVPSGQWPAAMSPCSLSPFSPLHAFPATLWLSELAADAAGRGACPSTAGVWGGPGQSCLSRWLNTEFFWAAASEGTKREKTLKCLLQTLHSEKNQQKLRMPPSHLKCTEPGCLKQSVTIHCQLPDSTRKCCLRQFAGEQASHDVLPYAGQEKESCN